MFIKTKKLYIWVFTFMAVSVVGKVSWNFLTNIDRLELKENSIKITGNNMISDNKIIGKLNNYYHKNLLKLNTKEIENKIEKFQRISQTKVIRDFPDGLIVQVQEVAPVGYMMKSSGRHVVTREGEIFPGIEGPPLKFKVSEKEKIIKISKLLDSIIEVNRDFHNNIKAIDLNYKEDVEIYLRRGVRIIWPSLPDLKEESIRKNIYLVHKTEEQYELTNNRNVENIDMRYIKTDMNNKIDGAIIVK